MVIRARILDVQPDWQITEAASGDEAVELIDKDTPDLFIHSLIPSSWHKHIIVVL